MQYFHIPQLNTLDLVSFDIKKNKMNRVWLHVMRYILKNFNISPKNLVNIFLGQYGYPFNPWGDIIAVAEACWVSSKDASLALSVLTSVSLLDAPGRDIIEYNAARIYGPLMYPFLTTNWKFVFPPRGKSLYFLPYLCNTSSCFRC